MKRKAVAELRAIEGFLREWDPLSVMGGDSPASDLSDEYDSYATVIHGLLRQGCGTKELLAELMRIESETMGIAPEPTRDLAVAQKIVAWWEQSRADAR